MMCATGDFICYRDMDGSVKQIITAMQNMLGCVIRYDDLLIWMFTMQSLADACSARDGRVYSIYNGYYGVKHALTGGVLSLQEKIGDNVETICAFEYHEVMTFGMSDDNGLVGLCPAGNVTITLPRQEGGEK